MKSKSTSEYKIRVSQRFGSSIGQLQGYIHSSNEQLFGEAADKLRDSFTRHEVTEADLHSRWKELHLAFSEAAPTL